MEPATHHTKRHRRATVVTTTPPPPPPPPPGEVIDASPQKSYYEDHLLITLSKPAGLLVQLLATQAELIFTTISVSQTFPSRVAHGVSTALRRVACGLLGAAYMCAVLLATLVLAVLIGIALVRFWVEDPVSVRQPLYFDYTHAHPVAAVSLGGTGVKAGRVIPAGHVARVSLVLFMPESEYNRWIGIFQVTAEVIASTGDIVASSSQPCMLRFQSLPVRLMRTFVMGIPLLVGVSDETQKQVVEVLRYKESNHKTAVVRVRLQPRSGASDLPQIYSAEMIINSRLPRRKELVYNWKWTLYVWISLYAYVMLLIMLACCFKPFGISRRRSNVTEQLPTGNAEDQMYNLSVRGGDFSDEFSDALMRWRERTRSKRKAPFPYVRLSEFSEGSASSAAGGEKSEVIDDFAASESSVCVGG